MIRIKLKETQIVKVDVLNGLKDKLKYLKNIGREIIVFLAVTKEKI
jgi:predicted  nucleic acid-binding Zn ribbon protein